MAEPIVLELQRLAADKSHDIGDLLRKALIVATKLRIEDFVKWINQELKGYDKRNEIPDYRVIPTEVRAVNPVTGRIMPVFYADPRIDERFSKVPVGQAIGELADLLTSDESAFQMSLSPSERRMFLEGMDSPLPCECFKRISRTSVCGIADAVRNTILEWALRLEEQGILGEGMTFSKEEKKRAANSTSIHIGNFQGVLGDVSGSTVSQNLQLSVNVGDSGSLERVLSQHGIDKTDIQALGAAIDADPKPQSPSNFGPQVSKWLGAMMTKAASGAWKVTLDTAAKLLPTAIAAYYGLTS